MDRRLRELKGILDREAAHGLSRLETRDLTRLPRLYRYTSSLIARLETGGHDPALSSEAQRLLGRAHLLLYRDLDHSREPLPKRALRYFTNEVPRAVRAERKLLGASFALLYGLVLIAYFAVSSDLELAYSLLDPGVVAAEIRQLEETPAGEPFRGNFDFGGGESPGAAALIMTNNLRVALIFFVAGLIPPLLLYILTLNSLMLGTYTAVAGHWGQAGAITSILWCHGVLEIQAIVVAGAAGLVLVRALIAPGPWTRRHALVREGQRALTLVAAVLPMLIVAGLIEGFISPHAPLALRVTIGALSGVALLCWVLLGGRAESHTLTARS